MAICSITIRVHTVNSFFNLKITYEKWIFTPNFNFRFLTFDNEYQYSVKFCLLISDSSSLNRKWKMSLLSFSYFRVSKVNESRDAPLCSHPAWGGDGVTPNTEVGLLRFWPLPLAGIYIMFTFILPEVWFHWLKISHTLSNAAVDVSSPLIPPYPHFGFQNLSLYHWKRVTQTTMPRLLMGFDYYDIINLLTPSANTDYGVLWLEAAYRKSPWISDIKQPLGKKHPGF